MEEPTQCLECGAKVTSKYCSECGQKTAVERITFSGLFQSAATTLSNLDKGILFNLKHLTIAPGATIRDYLRGKRKSYFKPVQYAIIAVTLLTVADYYFGARDSAAARPEDPNIFYLYGVFIRRNLKYLWLLNMVFFSIPTYFFFKRYNFAEHITINAFIIGHCAFLSIILLLLLPYPIILNPVTYFAVAVMYYFVFRNTDKPVEVAVISLLSVFVGGLLFFLVPFFGYWLFASTP
jgi:hypothetical protein